MGQPPWIRRGHHVAVRYTTVARCTVWSCASPRVCVQTRAASRRFAANVKVNGWQLTGRGQEARPRRGGVKRPLQLNFRWKKKVPSFILMCVLFLSVSLVRTEPECHADRRTFNRQLSLFVKVVARKMICLKKKVCKNVQHWSDHVYKHLTLHLLSNDKLVRVEKQRSIKWQMSRPVCSLLVKMVTLGFLPTTLLALCWL